MVDQDNMEAAVECRASQSQEGSLKIYILYVHDDRYSVPNLDGVIVRDVARAIEIASERLAGSLHHRAVELWEDECLIYRLDRSELNGAAD